jgi:hypothetical protein
VAIVSSIRDLLDKLVGRSNDLDRDVQAAADARRRGPDVVDSSEGVPPVPYGHGGSIGGSTG